MADSNAIEDYAVGADPDVILDDDPFSGERLCKDWSCDVGNAVVGRDDHAMRCEPYKSANRQAAVPIEYCVVIDTRLFADTDRASKRGQNRPRPNCYPF